MGFHSGRLSGKDSIRFNVGADTHLIYNHVLGRMEVWKRCCGGRIWRLVWAQPSYNVDDRFECGSILAPTILGLNSDITWSVNGLVNGVAPDENCFENNDEVGGGLIMMVPSAVNDDDDYVAMHWGDSYPVDLSLQPHMRIIINFVNSSDCGYLAGLVGPDNKSTGTDAFTLPDDIIGVRLDTDAYGDSHIYFLVRVAGVNFLELDLGENPVDDSLGIIRIGSNDELQFVLDGQVVVEVDSDNLPTVRMQPYSAVIARTAAAPADIEVTLQRFQLLMVSPQM